MVARFLVPRFLTETSPILAQQWGDSSFGNKDLETPFCEGFERLKTAGSADFGGKGDYRPAACARGVE